MTNHHVEEIELTPEQVLHNRLLDLEIAMAKKYNAMVESNNREILKRWEESGEPWCYIPGFDMSPPKIVMGIRYVK